MFERFLESFGLSPASPSVGPPWNTAALSNAAGYPELAAALAGCAVNRGLYRFHDASSGPSAEAMVAEAFPELAGRAVPFAGDWLGRQFAVDSQRVVAGEQLVLLVEPGTGEVLEIPVSFAAFHEQELVDHHDAALASGFFASWVEANPGALPLTAEWCVGYRVPLFLGGADSIENLELIDLDVYWSLCGQLRRGVRGMLPGTSIRDLAIEG